MQPSFDMSETTLHARMAWAVAARGLLALLFGGVALIFTRATLFALVVTFGVFALLSGVASLVAAFHAQRLHRRWGWLVASGALSLIAGVVSLVWPGLTVVAMVYLVASWAVLTGVAESVFAIRSPGAAAPVWLLGLCGALSVVFGFLLAIWPGVGALTLTVLVGDFALIYGVLLLATAYRLRLASAMAHAA